MTDAAAVGIDVGVGVGVAAEVLVGVGVAVEVLVGVGVDVGQMFDIETIPKPFLSQFCRQLPRNDPTLVT